MAAPDVEKKQENTDGFAYKALDDEVKEPLHNTGAKDL
jgi:hypothetical protein